MLSNPRYQILDSFDKFSEDDALKNLDRPKQEALRELIGTIPFYLVQGPPGVGKTRLVRDLVQRRFADELTTRLLLTAQSNSAVDHLMDELADALRSNTAQRKPLVVRCRSRASAESGPFEIGQQDRFEAGPE
jgi:hypothetical protein